jgi:Arc/MetJ family transcription regulator
VALLDEARTALGFTSKTDTVIYALREVVRRSRADELKALIGTVQFEFDPTDLRQRDRGRA